MAPQDPEAEELERYQHIFTTNIKRYRAWVERDVESLVSYARLAATTPGADPCEDLIAAERALVAALESVRDAMAGCRSEDGPR